jgi:Ni,Fe-hydrogenase maturation factor
MGAAVTDEEISTGRSGVNSDETLHSASPRDGGIGTVTDRERDRSGALPPGSDEESVQLVVVGCGVDGGGDDAVGLEIVRRIASADAFECSFQAPEDSDGEVRQIAAGDSYLLFVDAVVTRSRPGAIHLVSLPNSGLEPRNLMSASLSGAKHAALLAIEIPEVRTGPGLSEVVARAADFVVANFDSLQRQVLVHEHDNLPLAIHILAPENEPLHA